MSTDTTSARAVIERVVKINPTTDRIVSEHFGLSEVDLAQGHEEPEVEYLRRLTRAYDSRLRELENEVRQKDRDYTGVTLEYQDLADENRRLKQELEINRVVADARDGTIKKLKAELAELKSGELCGK